MLPLLAHAHTDQRAPGPFVSFTQLGDQYGISPYESWKTVQTPHFRITYPDTLEPVVSKIAGYLEEAHLTLSPVLYWEPRQKTQVVLTDNTDLANGLTAATLRLGLILYMTPPDNWTAISYYDDWLKLLIIHEYTHLLNLDTTQGLMEAIRAYGILAFLGLSVGGDVIRPNHLLPSWFLEGLAVYFETKHTRGGRGRSPYWNMILRAAVESGVLGTSDFSSIDQIDGDYPYFPTGEANYLFGYQLVQQVAQDAKLETQRTTADGTDGLKDGQDALGRYSLRSGGRIPFFINGNLENITGGTWYDFWNQWLEATRERSQAELKLIRSKPLSITHKIIGEKGENVLGAQISPDGKWLAYHLDTPHRRSGVYLKNLENQEITRLGDQVAGVGMAFTPDSKWLVQSGVRRKRIYNLFSDLEAYRIPDGKRVALTHALRAKDPDVSRDGKRVVFTLTELSSVSLAIADLTWKDGNPQVENIQKLTTSQPGDRVSTPKFSPDGKRIVYSFHKNQQLSEELIEFDLGTKNERTLVTDGKFNRFPVFSPNGSLYFVSDASGMDLLYKHESPRPRLVTRVTTGIWLPAFDPHGKLYASVFSSDGWGLTEVGMTESSETLALPPLAVPRGALKYADTVKPSSSIELERGSSPFHWLIPRAWSPVLIFQNSSRFYIGGDIYGFDETYRQSYELFAAYDTLAKTADVSLYYSNRSLGPTISVQGVYDLYGGLIDGSELIYYDRRLNGSLSISFPFQWTWSVLTPYIAAGAERIYRYVPPDTTSPYDQSAIKPTLTLGADYSDIESTDVGISPEKGRFTSLAAREYLNNGENAVKGLLADVEHFRLSRHVIFAPSVAASYVTIPDIGLSSAKVRVKGRASNSWSFFGGYASQSLDSLSLRGYPNTTFEARAAGVGSFELRFPIAEIFRGWGTNPLILKQLYGFTFAEAAYIPLTTTSKRFFGSYGLGLRLSSKLLVNLPVTISAELHQGTERTFGGKTEFVFAISGLSLGI